MPFTNITKKTQGKDYNYFQKFEVSSATFQDNPDGVITFSTQSVRFLNEETGGTNVLEYSFNGNTVHGECDPTQLSKSKTFDNRTVCLMWFRVKSGSTGPITFSVEAWGF